MTTEAVVQVRCPKCGEANNIQTFPVALRPVHPIPWVRRPELVWVRAQAVLWVLASAPRRRIPPI